METSQASTTTSDDKVVKRPPICYAVYFIVTYVLVTLTWLYFFPFNLAHIEAFGNGKEGCYLEVFTDYVSVTKATNANVSTADWRIGLVAKSPVSSCNISLQTTKSRLFRGDKVMFELSPLLDGFRQNIITLEKMGESATIVDFNSSVVWDFGVEVVAGIKTDVRQGFLLVTCGDIPVNFTVDRAGNIVNGSLLGNTRRCDNLYRDSLDFTN